MSTVALQVPSKYEARVLELMTEPRTPNEVAKLLKIHQRTAQTIMMELAMDGKLNHKKAWRLHIFWRAESQP